jgi:hypothetical protein
MTVKREHIASPGVDVTDDDGPQVNTPPVGSGVGDLPMPNAVDRLAKVRPDSKTPVFPGVELLIPVAETAKPKPPGGSFTIRRIEGEIKGVYQPTRGTVRWGRIQKLVPTRGAGN